MSMEPLDHSVYHVRRGEEERRYSAPDQNADRMWAEARRKLRRQTLLYVLTLLVSIVVVASAILFYYWKINETWRRSRPVRPGMAQTPSPLRFDVDPETMYLFEELSPPRKNEPAEDLPLSISSVKMAAYHLVQAERAARQDRYEDALTSYQNAARIFPDMLGVQGQIGVLALRLKQYALSAEAFEKVAREAPMTFSLANNLGVAYLGMEDFSKAEAAFRLAVKINPQYAMAYFNLATLYLRQGQLEKAVDYFEQYMTLQPNDTMAGQTYALILIQLEQWDRAAKLLQMIARVAPDVAPIHFRLAQALSHGPQRRAAVEALKRAVSLVDPRQALAWMSRPEFNLIRDDPGFQDLLLELGSKE